MDYFEPITKDNGPFLSFSYTNKSLQFIQRSSRLPRKEKLQVQSNEPTKPTRLLTYHQ